jgi:hypothetical protein
MEPNKSEKIKKVIEMYEQQKTYREIAKSQHLSMTDISSTIKKHTGEHSEEEKMAPISKTTQALKLFSQNKTPLEVAIDLDINETEVEKVYKDYWRLNGLAELHKAYVDDIQLNLPSFLEFYKVSKEEGVNEHDIRHIIQYGDQLQFLDYLVKDQAKKAEELVKQVKNLKFEINKLQHRIKFQKNECQQYQSTKDKISHELHAKSEFLKATEDSIHRLTSGKKYTKIKETTKQTATSILDNKNELLLAAIVTVSIALRNDPKKSALITSFSHVDSADEFQLTNPNSWMDPVNDPYFRDCVKTHYKSVLQTSDLLYDRILDIIQNRNFQSD